MVLLDASLKEKNHQIPFTRNAGSYMNVSTSFLLVQKVRYISSRASTLGWHINFNVHVQVKILCHFHHTTSGTRKWSLSKSWLSEKDEPYKPYNYIRTRCKEMCATLHCLSEESCLTLKHFRIAYKLGQLNSRRGSSAYAMISRFAKWQKIWTT